MIAAMHANEHVSAEEAGRAHHRLLDVPAPLTREILKVRAIKNSA